VAHFAPTGLVKKEHVEYREIQKVEEQLLHPFPCTTTYAIDV
jgi:hypothetical protein